MTSQEEIAKTLRLARILCIAFLVAPLIHIITIFLMRSLLDFFVYFPDDPKLTLIVEILAFLAIVSLAAGVYFPRWYIKRRPRGLGSIYMADIFRWNFFEAVAIYGLILGVLGAKWEIILPFFIVAIVALILGFPTEERWNKIMEQGTRTAE